MPYVEGTGAGTASGGCSACSAALDAREHASSPVSMAYWRRPNAMGSATSSSVDSAKWLMQTFNMGFSQVSVRGP
jgi:hypothetical protein